VRRVRFANANDGWAFDPDLWTTHDAGGHWVRQSLPPDGDAQSLEVDAGVVHALVLDQAGVQILSSPVMVDRWTTSATTIESGAGPVPQAQLVLQGGGGWAIEVDRSVVGGARLNGGQWAAWQPPCASAGGDAAVCDEGTWTGGSQSVHLYVSADGGASFRRVAAPLPISGASSVTRSLAGGVVVGGSDAVGGTLLASFDGGSTWATVYRGGDLIADDELGFTTATQGVAISLQGTTGQLLMTYDGGRHWGAVTFG